MKYKLINIEKVGKRDILLTVEERFLWFKPVVSRYRGGLTVWHDADTGERMPSTFERMLSQMSQKTVWKMEDEEEW